MNVSNFVKVHQEQEREVHCFPHKTFSRAMHVLVAIFEAILIVISILVVLWYVNFREEREMVRAAVNNEDSK